MIKKYFLILGSALFVFFLLNIFVSEGRGNASDRVLEKKQQPPLVKKREKYTELDVERISNEFLSSVFEQNYYFDFVEGFQFTPEKVNEVLGIVPGIRYRRVEAKFDIKNLEHIEKLKNTNFSNGTRLVKFSKKQPIYFIAVNLLKLTRSEIEKIEMLNEWDQRVSSPFNKISSAIKNTTGLQIKLKISDNLNFLNSLPLSSIIFINSPDMGKVNAGIKRAAQWAPFETPLNLRSVFQISPNASSSFDMDGYISLRNNFVTSRSQCGDYQKTALGSLENIISGCILKSLGLVNWNNTKSIDLGLTLLKILYDDRLQPGMNQKQVEAVLPAIIQDVIKR